MVFTLYWIMKRSIAKCVSGRVPVHIGNTIARAIFIPVQECPAPLLKVESPVPDSFLQWSRPSPNTFVRAEIVT